jgi:hypothetical protein
MGRKLRITYYESGGALVPYVTDVTENNVALVNETEVAKLFHLFYTIAGTLSTCGFSSHSNKLLHVFLL